MLQVCSTFEIPRALAEVAAATSITIYPFQEGFACALETFTFWRGSRAARPLCSALRAAAPPALQGCQDGSGRHFTAGPGLLWSCQRLLGASRELRVPSAGCSSRFGNGRGAGSERAGSAAGSGARVGLLRVLCWESADCCSASVLLVFASGICLTVQTHRPCSQL